MKAYVTFRPKARMVSLTRISTGHHYRSNNCKVIYHIHSPHKSELLHRLFDDNIEFMSEIFEFRKHSRSDR
jgi:hypothetical protein